jgi:hypothetical protein
VAFSEGRSPAQANAESCPHICTLIAADATQDKFWILNLAAFGLGFFALAPSDWNAQAGRTI